MFPQVKILKIAEDIEELKIYNWSVYEKYEYVYLGNCYIKSAIYKRFLDSN